MAIEKRNPRVLIAGGGIGGLAAALALLKRGFDVDVYEQAPELREAGAGVQLSANAIRVFHELGVHEALRALACEASGKELRLWNSGQTWKLFDLGAVSVERYGFPYYTAYRPDLLAVLADGVHSRIRQALFGPDQAQFTGLVAWRGTIPMDRLPGHMRRLVGSNWVGPGRHVVHYPVHRGEYMNFIGVVEGRDWQVESWTERGSREECHADFDGWHDDVHRMIASIETPFIWALVGRAPMERWSAGRVSLLGDACHPTLPFLAQGAAMALEDGYILARALQAAGPDTEQGLARYEGARRERTAKVVHGSAEMARRFHNPALAESAGAQDYVNREWSEERVKSRYEWLFNYDVTAVAV